MNLEIKNNQAGLLELSAVEWIKECVKTEIQLSQDHSWSWIEKKIVSKYQSSVNVGK